MNSVSNLYLFEICDLLFGFFFVICFLRFDIFSEVNLPAGEKVPSPGDPTTKSDP
jgi:hypothetical protein